MMANVWFKVRYSWRPSFDMLDDAELRSLVYAIFAYAEDGEDSPVSGKAKYVWPMIRSELQRDREERENGKKGGRPSERQDKNPPFNPSVNPPSTDKRRKEKEKNREEPEKEPEEEKETEKRKAARAFEDFWSSYPRKTGKQDAYKAFTELKPDETLMQTILAAIESQKKSEQWTKDGGQYIPAPANWLNGRRWEDELPKARPKWMNDAAHNYTQREYTEEQLLAVSDDLIAEARKYRGVSQEEPARQREAT